MFEVEGSKPADRMYDSQTIQPFNAPSCKANTDQEIKSNNVDAIDANSNMPEYFRPRMDRVADKSAGQILIQRILYKFNDIFQKMDIHVTSINRDVWSELYYNNFCGKPYVFLCQIVTFGVM